MPASLFDAYVSSGASEFFPSTFSRAEDRLRAVERARPRIAPAVLARLAAQNERFGASTARSANLAALERGAAAVVTGQQVGLFLGPLFTVYKAASAVRVARALAESSGRPVVPVFWLQTEDHDLPEIACCTVARTSAEPLALSLPVDPKNHVSIAHLALPNEVASLLATLDDQLGHLPAAALHLERLARHYRPGARWADAFAGVLAELFEPEGLLLLDPRDPVLAREICAVHRRALHEAPALASVLSERSEALERAGYEAVVHVRAGAPLAFYHPGPAEGPRFRLAPCPDDRSAFVEVGGERRHAIDQLTERLTGDPMCFSTSALLRPIVQDTLLPTAAYVGGPAEVAYYAQLAPLYASFGLRMPLVVPRARFRVIEPAAARLLHRHGITPSLVEQGEEALLVKLAAVGGVAPAAFEQALRSGFESVLAAELAKLNVPAEQLQKDLMITRGKLTTTSQKLAQRYASVLARADTVRVNDVRRLRLMLQPNGAPQERVYNLSYFAARFGERAFLERVLAAIDPFDAERKELYL